MLPVPIKTIEVLLAAMVATFVFFFQGGLVEACVLNIHKNITIIILDGSRVHSIDQNHYFFIHNLQSHSMKHLIILNSTNI